MKTILLATTLVATCLPVFGQIKFESGYYITTSGQKKEGQIFVQNRDWRDNPVSFDFRPSADAPSISVPANEVRELGVSDAVFLRLKVLMDRSTDDFDRMNKSRSPEFASETLFLRLVVSGNASLYQYDEGNLHRFFYSLEGGEISQLVYKRFLTNNGEVTSNEDYKQQLFNSLKCDGLEKSEIETARYQANDLKKLLVAYNRCKGGEAKSYTKTDRSPWPIHLSIRPGLTYNKAEIKNIGLGGGGTANIDATASWRIGLEVEGMLPFRDGLVALFGEVTYTTFNAAIPQGTVKVDYKVVEISLGGRKYFKTGGGKLYVAANATFAMPQGSTVTIVASTFDAKPTVTPVFSLGYQKNRFSGEVYYYLARNLLKGNSTYEAMYGGPGLILGYRLH